MDTAFFCSNYYFSQYLKKSNEKKYYHEKIEKNIWKPKKYTAQNWKKNFFFKNFQSV
jgi:hypothetical protein